MDKDVVSLLLFFSFSRNIDFYFKVPIQVSMALRKYLQLSGSKRPKQFVKYKWTCSSYSLHIVLYVPYL